MGTLVNGIKDIFSTSKTTATHLPVCASDGTPQGRISVGNLASVLGEIAITQTMTSIESSELLYQSKAGGKIDVFRCRFTENPIGFGDVAVLYSWDNNAAHLVLYSLSGRCAYLRIKNNGTWETWQKIATDIPSFYKNYSTIDALSNAIKTTGNVGVAVFESDYLRFRQPDEALSKASIAVGVWIQEGGKLIVVAKDQQASTKWATSNVSGGTTAKGREAAIADMDGRANTSTIITTLGDNAPAAKFCHEYYPSNVDAANAFVGAGRWWLPSGGELWMIWSHLLEVNRILAQIGGTPLNRSQLYWSSTETSSTNAWTLAFGNGYFVSNGKTLEFSVRPVSAFY